MPIASFLDTSALLPRLLTNAPGSSWVRRVCDPKAGNHIAIAEITEAELVAALNQLRRGGVVRKKRCDDMVDLFWTQVDGREYRQISITSSLVRRAAEPCGNHALKGYDAVQLACALKFRDDVRLSDAASRPVGGTLLGDPIFLTADNRLRDAALAEGFTVDSPRDHP